MPELPEVETIVRGLTAHLLNRKVTRVSVPGHAVFPESRQKFCQSIQDSLVAGLDRHGKTIYIQLLKPSLSRALTLQIHLGMTGQLLWTPKSEALLSHTHVVFHLDHPTHDLRFRDIRRFGGMSLTETDSLSPKIPDAWKISKSELEGKLKSIRGMLKHALLSQKVVMGLGNIYVDEALHRSKLHPQKLGSKVKNSQWTLLADSIRFVLGRSIRVGGTSFSNYVDLHGSRGGFKARLAVYGKEGEPCPVCRTPIQKIHVAGRGTHFCRRCQTSPR